MKTSFAVFHFPLAHLKITPMNFRRFFKQQMLIAHFYGVPVRIDFRWFVVSGVLTILAAVGIQNSTADFALSLLGGGAATLVFVGSIALHELAHTYAAHRENVAVLEIALYPFGGVTRWRHEPDAPRVEWLIAAAGPSASFALACLFLVVSWIAKSFGAEVFSRLAVSLCLLNALLAIFNLLPGYPLDGGRILRSYLRRNGADFNDATVSTAKAGRIIAVSLIAGGLFTALFQTGLLVGGWTIVSGVFLWDAAGAVIAEVKKSARRTVEGAMRLPVPIAPEIDLQEFMERVLPTHRRAIFPVADRGDFYGMLLVEDVKNLPSDAWEHTKVSEIMRPVKPDYFVETATPLIEANRLMKSNGVGAVGVLDRRGSLVGFLHTGKAKR